MHCLFLLPLLVGVLKTGLFKGFYFNFQSSTTTIDSGARMYLLVGKYIITYNLVNHTFLYKVQVSGVFSYGHFKVGAGI